MPLWPVAPAAGLGLAAYAVAKSRKTVESEDGFNEDDRPQPGRLQEFVAGAILAGAAGALFYLGGAYVLAVGTPMASRLMAGPGQQALRLAQSEAGAINPGQAKAVNELPETFVRVIPNTPDALSRLRMLGPSGQARTFVTAAEDIAGLNAQQIRQRLAIEPAAEYIVIRFEATKYGAATPISYNNPSFIGRGLTAGGAREFLIQNGPIPKDAVIEVVK
ncbi:MAG: polymorphic toxin type 10 domain-containing protein [Elusimicrobia bacterium]|nr:polymorphic toxin type 10 domain-containing protein [Elusimicrobiota bacterium]